MEIILQQTKQFPRQDLTLVITGDQISQKIPIPTEIIDDEFVQLYVPKSMPNVEYKYYLTMKDTNQNKITLSEMRKNWLNIQVHNPDERTTAYSCCAHDDCNFKKLNDSKNNVFQHVAQDCFLSVYVLCKPPRQFPKNANIFRHFLMDHSCKKDLKSKSKKQKAKNKKI